MRKVWHGLKVHYPAPLGPGWANAGHLRDQGSGVRSCSWACQSPRLIGQ